MPMHPRTTILALAAAGALGFSGLAMAQPPAAPPVQQTIPGPMHGPMQGAGAGPMPGFAAPGFAHHRFAREHGWHGRDRARHAFLRRIETWGLFHRPADLALTPADVQTIAQAILLRHGEHSWKVGNVTQDVDHTVGFAFVTGHGDVVASFTMNTETGRITRVN